LGGEESTNLDPFNKYDLVIDRWATNLELMPLKKSGIEAASPGHMSTAVAVASSGNNQFSDGNGHDHGGDGCKRCGGDNDGGEIGDGGEGNG
jgi:hypothetical protein